MTTTTTTTPSIMAEIKDGWIVLDTVYQLKDTVKSLSGARWNPETKQWWLPATPAAAEAVSKIASAEDCDEHLSAGVISLAARAGLAQRIKDNADSLEPIPRTKVTPWRHQLVSYHMVKDQAATCLALDMGLGKSKVIVDIVQNLDEIRKVLIVCPSSVIDVWPREFAKHAVDFHDLTLVALRTGIIRMRTNIAKYKWDLAEAQGNKLVVIINYEAAWRDAFKEWALSQKWDLIVADEIHRIKAPGGKQSRFMQRLGPKAKRRVGLTGTPMPHSPLDVYAEYRFLDPTIFGTSFVRFRARYAVMGGFENHQVLRFQNQGELHEKFYSIAHRAIKSECLDLPEIIHEKRELELSKDARRVYRELEHEFISELEEGTITASNALARLLRLQQITSGFCVTEDATVVQLDNAKADAMSDILEDLGTKEPVVVFCRFHNDLDRIKESTKKNKRICFELSGRRNELEQWQDSKGGEVLAVQIQAGGVGIDLTRACYCVYYSLGYSLGDYEQSMARLHRPGQERPVTYIHLAVKGTVDMNVYRALQKRAKVIQSVLAEMKEQ